MKCDICGGEMKLKCLIFVPDYDYYRIGIPKGKNLFVCVECELNYLSQYLNMDNVEIQEWLDWILRMENGNKK